MRRYKGKSEVLAVAPEILSQLGAGRTVVDIHAELFERGIITISWRQFYRQVARLQRDARPVRVNASPTRLHAASNPQHSRQSTPPPQQPADGAPFAIRRPDFDPAKKAKI
ncbi:TraK family protein [Pacificispira spongiicola]|uniref:TraK family protein n=1 Tax=Pacificispira spongiicola TaxID=2729598 RepID=UPI00387375F0